MTATVHGATVHHGSVFARLPRGVLALIALVSLGAVGAALVSQHVFEMKPCPWCIFQRVIYLAIALVAGIGWLVRSRPVTLASTVLVLALALGGIASAVFQHQVASQDVSCALTLADRFLFVTGLETMLPFLFQVTATCMEAASYQLLGLGFEVWSGLLFALISITAVLILSARRARIH
ncbi:disulfide bond formation protein B [Caldimonas sp. KR1-144]|uniref:disulfide bond formation protein B n=1 Tax=Caldimonas sp. KR1-144 TaxID=3400911 RepID=UPI003C051B77